MKLLILLMFLGTGCFWATGGATQRTGAVIVKNDTVYDIAVYAVRNGQRACSFGRVTAHMSARFKLPERCLTFTGHLGIRFVPTVYRGRYGYDLFEEIFVGGLPAVVELRLLFPLQFSTWTVRSPKGR